MSGQHPFKAVLLAAGTGERLSPITQTLPKALLPIDGETIISRLIRQLDKRGIAEIILIVGYEANQIREHVRQLDVQCPIHIVENAEYATTGTAYSAKLAAAYIGNHPFLLIDGDIVTDGGLFDAAFRGQERTLFYESKAISSPEEMKVECTGDRIRLGKEISTEDSLGEFVGITRMDADAAATFFASLDVRNHTRTYYEEAINTVSEKYSFTLTEVAEGSWIEVDFVTDYLEVLKRFSGQGQEVRMISNEPAVVEQVLLCPGPVMVSTKVKSALLHADIGHRETEFIEILARTRQKLNRVYGVETSEYTNVILTGSGTAANESLLSSYGPGRRILILSNGEFGNRLIDIARCHEIDVIPLEFGWGRAIDLDVVKKKLDEAAVDAVMMVHHETSTGMLNPLFELGSLLDTRGIDFLVDAVSSLGAERVDVEKAHVTFCTSSANKAIASLPGLSFVCGKRAAFQALKDRNRRTRYLDLYKHYEYEDIQHQTPNTPAVSLFYALETALDELLEDTLEKRMEHYGRLSGIVRGRLRELGIKTVIPESQMSRVLTTAYYPEGLDVEAFHEWVKRHNFVIYRGKGPFLGKAFQVANIGHVHEDHVFSFMKLVEQACLSGSEVAIGKDEQ